MTELPTPSKATIQSYDAMDRIGRLVLENGEVLRFGETACQDFVPVVGLEVFVTATAPYPLGGTKAVKLRARRVTENQVREEAATKKSDETAELAAQRERRRQALLPIITHDRIVAGVKALAPPDDEDEDNQALYAFVEDLEVVGPSLAHVTAILQGIAESPPMAHFGSPGALVHYVEKFHGRGYEEALFETASRTPTMHFMHMLARVARGEDDEHVAQALSILRSYEANTAVVPDIREAVTDFLRMLGELSRD